MDTPSDGMLAGNLTMILVLASAVTFKIIYLFIYSFIPSLGQDGF